MRPMEVKRNGEGNRMIGEDITMALRITVMIKILALTVLWFLM